MAAFIFLATGLSIEAFLAAFISIFLIKSGLEMLRDTISQILGERIDASVSSAVKKTILGVEGVQGAYDLLFSDYGPDRVLASVHIEIPDTFTADQIDRITRTISERVYEEHNVAMVSVGVYSINTKNEAASKVRTEISKIARNHTEVLQIHGFFVDFEKKAISFDMVLDFVPNRKEVFDTALSEIKAAFPEYTISANMDTSYSD